ncbi:MAG: c-type cytochrome biogenesis protein CcmI [Roseibium sp.]|uniref:c-type cytochrome biogenesis protein CcmI n=1 Tax=Roseibium sp. TaxID=1936156 RepID=UPI002629ED94|nr:c-type cytochrome biogenesis protein CcmI [Roseibium sp.]MCV0425362.1 c-type cytochrome biogenesis protein CcmI [Roseibium sp.]
MVFWILIAVMTGVAALSVLVPLSRTKRFPAASAANADEEVYRDQLAAIDSELERGLIDPGAAEAARTEVARRLLAAHDKNSGTPEARSEGARLKLAQALALLALPVMALGIYFTLGAPDVPDQPLTTRLNAPAEEQSVDILVARVERHLADNPEDGQGWSVIAPVYLTLGQPQASARAYANAIRILGPRPDWLTDMGEAMTMANQGLVSADARQAFEQAVEMEPDAVKPRFFLAIALGQEGKKDSAIKAWEALLEGADETEAWVQAARQQLAELNGGSPLVAALGGPSTEDIAAAQDMDAADRQQMISGMVSGLAERLEADGGSPEEWNRLIRAYMVLGEKQKAETALADAQAAYADKPEQLSLIKDAASQLGLTGS